ncbi:MAG: PAS domain S-box protein [Bacteroidetes bacterium]|nr:PAS domain S-box protein [Bacteroidota bacterium]
MPNNKLYKNLPNKLNQLLAFFNSTSDSIIICNNDFTISYVNPVFERLTGYKAKNVLGKSYKMIDADTKYETSNKPLWVALNKGKTYQLTSHNKKQNGEYYWIENNIMPVTDENERGNITHLIFIGKNITEQTKTLNTLTKSERALEEAGKIAKLGYYILDIKQDFWTSSTELNNIFGIKKDGKKNLDTWVQLIHPDDKESMLNYFTNEVLTKKKKFDIEYKIINQKTRQVKWVHGLGNLTFDENGNPVKMFGTIQDITERKHIEQALIESEEKFRSIFHSQKSGIILVIDENGKILEWNKGAEIAFGYSEKEMQKKTLTDLMPKRYREKHQQGLEHAFKSRALSNLGNTFELFGLRKNEEEFPIELTLGSWESNGKLFFSAIIFDISKRKETEKRLFHADTIIQEIGSIILLSDCNGQLIFCSPSIKNLTGYTSKEVKGNKWWEVSFVNKEESDFAKKRLIDYSKNKNKINTCLEGKQKHMSAIWPPLAWSLIAT